MDDLWTTQQAAQYFGVPPATLVHWRYRQTGPPSYKVGRHVRYRPSELADWLREQR